MLIFAKKALDFIFAANDKTIIREKGLEIFLNLYSAKTGSSMGSLR